MVNSSFGGGIETSGSRVSGLGLIAFVAGFRLSASIMISSNRETSFLTEKYVLKPPSFRTAGDREWESTSMARFRWDHLTQLLIRNPRKAPPKPH